MKLWIDDLREPPTSGPDATGWLWVKTSADAIEQLAFLSMRPKEISFDHDLGGDDTTRRVMLWMIEHGVWPERLVIHTANPVGRNWLRGMADRYAPDTVEIISW